MNVSQRIYCFHIMRWSFLAWKPSLNAKGPSVSLRSPIRGMGAVQNPWEVMGCSFPNPSLGWEGCSLLRWLASPVNTSAMCVLLGWHESFASSQSMKCQCQQQSEISPDRKGETKACNFSLPDILAIIILSHLLKTKWFLSCRKGQNVMVSVPLEELINFPGTVGNSVRNMALISSITWPGVRTLGWSVS